VTDLPPIDLGTVLKQGDLSLKPRETPEDAAHRRRKDWVLFSIGLTALVALVIICTWVSFFDASATSDRQRIANSLLTLIIGGIVGYLVGKKS
jgi:hypothetical protein